jgi:hypothetical protein
MSAVNICPRSGIWNAFDRFIPRGSEEGTGCAGLFDPPKGIDPHFV